MRNNGTRRWLAAALMVSVVLLSVPVHAREDFVPRVEKGWIEWLFQGLRNITSVTLGMGMHADPNGDPVAPTGDDGTSVAAVPPGEESPSTAQ